LTQLSPSRAKQRFSSFLTPQELIEIDSFPVIYFAGGPDTKSPIPGDTPFHFYRWRPGDHLAYQYEIISLLGKGAFSEVLRCFDHKSQREVAIKALINTPAVHTQGLREIENLKRLIGVRGVCGFVGSFTFRNHLFLVSELLGRSLFEELQMRGFRGMAGGDVRMIARQLLESLAAIHECGIIHCDIKPENVLCAESAQSVRIIDFGSSVVAQERVGVRYVQSRFYRAPEVICGLPMTFAIDMWSVGCVIGELLCGSPLFSKDNDSDHLARIVELAGPPPPEFVQRKQELLGKGWRAGTKREARLKLEALLRTSSTACSDFVAQCLEWDPKKRLRARLGLEHEWLKMATRTGKS
jgi:dual specificity tyrosine-phosphorylation-regulated kinase 2/3/4